MSKPNLLIVSIEDLNDWIEPLAGHPDSHTPNLKKLATRGTSFISAYANVPACSPSRTTALFGQAPWRIGSYSNASRWEHCYPGGKRLSVIGCAKDSGYETIGAGKFFYGADKGIDRDEWDHYFVHPRSPNRPVSRAVKEGRLPKSNDYGAAGSDDKTLWDTANTESIIGTMKAGDAGKVWALGLFRPHLPFVVPQKYFDLIPQEPAPAPGLMGKLFTDEWDLEDVPEAAKSLIASEKLSDALDWTGTYLEFVRAYLASVAYADDLLGRLLDHLRETGLEDNTLVVVWSDHGWQFGEKTAFKKFTLWERSLRIPMIMAGPGIRAQVVDDPVSLLDLFPTIAAQLGLEPKHHLDGSDLSNILYRGAPLDRLGVVSVYPRERQSSELAFSIRDRRYRYTRYWDGKIELYDHSNDPFETENLAHGANELSGETARLDLILDEIVGRPAEVPPARSGMPTKRKAVRSGANATSSAFLSLVRNGLSKFKRQ